MLGPLPASCNGTCIVPPPVASVSELKRNMAAANEDLVRSLREDVESAVLLEKVLEEVELGRMCAPVEVGVLCSACSLRPAGITAA